MGGTDMTKKIVRSVALTALFLVPFTPLLVANSFFFPFITGKAFYFRILVEIAFSAWVVLAFIDKEYRPRFSWIGVAVVAFVAWMGIADLFALNVAKAFWSNFERMEGWILLIHLLGFFFASGAVLRVEKKWRAWFLTSLGVAVIISLYAFLQLSGSAAIHQGSTRIDASFGNSAYLAIYLLFTACIAFWLALTEKRPWLKWLLIAFAIVEAMLIFFTETRGTIIGLILGFSVAALLTALTAGKRVRTYAIGTLVIIALLVGSFYLARDSSFVQGNHTLQRLASISLSDGQTRFTLWGMALRGVSTRPLTGWGQEGFNYVFNQEYDPSLYQQEQWFDRAHNAFIDWLTAGGIPAFLAYIALFATALVLLWQRSELSRGERIALTAALVGYAVHNLFVFDNLYSYVYFFAILSLIDSQVARPIPKLEAAPVLDREAGIVYALPIAAAVALMLVWTVNVPGMRVASSFITALTPSPAGIAKNIETFEYLVAHPAFAAQEIREQLAAFSVSIVQIPAISQNDKQRVVSLALSEAQKQVDAYPLDARGYMQLSFIYRAIGDGDTALKAVEAALALSPKKEQFMIEAGSIAWDKGDSATAQRYFNAAYELGPQFPALAAYAAAGDIGVGDVKKAEATLLAAYGTTTVDSNILSIAYIQTKDWPRLIRLWQLRTSSPSATVEAWFGLAAAYYTSGNVSGAIRTVKEAAIRFPDAADSASSILKQIEAKTGAR